MEDWEGAFEDDLSQRRPHDDHVQKVLSFVQEHESILHSIDDTVQTSIPAALSTDQSSIKLHHEHPERVFTQDLFFSASNANACHNEVLVKVVSVLVFLCDEIHELKEIAQSKLYGPLVVFGQLAVESGDSSDQITFQPGEREKMIGTFLPILQEISNFIDRCYNLTANVVQQLASLLKSKEQLYKVTFQSAHMTTVFVALGELLSVLVSLDCIVQQNDVLLEAWSHYKTMISYARADPTSFGTDEMGVSRFERLLVSIDQSVMIGEIFKGCIEQNFETIIEDDSEVHVSVRSNQIFTTELLFCLKNHLENALNIIGTGAELFERNDVMTSLSLFALYRVLLPANVPPDPKLYKQLWGVQKVVPTVVICDKVVWNVGEFLQTYAPFDLKKPDPANPAAYRRAFIQQFDQVFSQKTAMLISQCSAWIVLTESRIQSTFRHDDNIDQLLDVRSSILLKGLSLANRARYLAQSCLVMHTSMTVPMTKSSLLDIALLIENLKAIELTLARKNSTMVEAHMHSIRAIAGLICGILASTRQRVNDGQGVNLYKADLLTAIACLDQLLKGTDSFTYPRTAALQILSEIIIGSKLFNEKESARLRNLVARLCAISSMHQRLQLVCDSSFLYYHLDILSPMVQSIYQQSSEANRLQYLLKGFIDGIRVCQMVAHVPANPFFLNLRTFLRDCVKKNIIEPLCRDIENDLRLHIHTKTLDHMQALNPKTDTLRPLRPFLDIPPLKILGTVLNIKNEVTHYLNRSFYNLTTVALHDWRTYSDMRSLAAEKLGLNIMDNFLPMGSLDQGLDVLQIMRNIHVFVSRFVYNMNMQQFVEFRPDKASKHLNTIKIQSIAASIRQHGLGVLNTTVNFTYQFLAQKFHIFSQFLFDDYIRAHLSREHRWFKKHKNEKEISNMYPYDRALNFVRDIRKLGVNDSGKTFLDQFRILITEIGNALGYVRMVRSASMYFCSEAVKFLPEIDDVVSFEQMAGKGKPNPDDPSTFQEGTGADFNEETVRAAKNLDEVVSTLIKNFGEGSDYFKVLVNVFQSVLLTSEHDHLRTFYMLVPSLCISWVEASLQAKDCMYKATRGVSKEMYFTDDGFAMGVAYCLAILKQTRKSDSLHWGDTVRHKYKVDLKNLQDQQAKRAEKEAKMKEKKEKEEKAKRGFFGFGGSKKPTTEEEEDYEDYEEVHTLQMTGKRLEAHRRETEQLFFSMSAAGIFFKRTDVDT